MKTVHFSSREQATKYLINQEFEFMGAPNRWRKSENDRVIYAKVQIGQHRVTITISE